MGQTTSSERQPPALPPRRPPESAQPYQELGDGRESDQQERAGLEEGGDGRWGGLRTRATSITGVGPVRARQPEYHSTYRRETRARSTLISEDLAAEYGVLHGREDVVLEQEERPLILRDMEVRLNDAPITNIQASPMPRRPSILSRLRFSRSGSRIEADGRGSEASLTHRRTPSDITPFQPSQADSLTRRNRFSMFDLPTRSLTSPQHPEEHHRPASISDLEARHENNEADPAASAPEPVHVMPRSVRVAPPYETGRVWERAYSGRLRRTLLGPIEDIFRPARSRAQRTNRTSSYQRHGGPDETTNLISPQATGTNASANDHPPRVARRDAPEGSEENPIELDSPDRPSSWLRRSAEPSDAAAGQGHRRGSRRVQNLLGGRSSRLIRREDDTPLSRVLQLAAAAIAAQLSGNSNASADLQSVGDDHFDGNLNAFIQSLNSAAEQSANEDSDSSLSSLPPLNFWRVFRFVNNNSQSSRAGGGQESSSEDSDGSGSRLVTLVVVGVRSVPTSTLMSGSTGTINANLDGLLALHPSSTESPNLGNGAQPEPMTMSARDRLNRRRPTSMAGSNAFPPQYDSQRYQGTSPGRLNRTTGLNPLRRSSTVTSSGTQTRAPSPFPDTSRLSRQSIPPHRYSTDPRNPASQEQNPTPLQSHPLSGHFDEPSNPSLRQRRRSDSHSHLGSGAARRNGVVEPDGASSNGRHWLIYVVGTNLSEDHPAFQAPSLFTDNPSYEDMLMLSTLLGPAKPPVATAQDLATAHGLYRLELRRADGTWLARTMDHGEGTDSAASPLIELRREVERCLVCLTDYESGDEIRELQKCNHLYHRECIDTWLTTGRNSCPLCRGQGVDEKNPDRPDSAGVDLEAA